MWKQHKYPESCLEFEYDPGFPIRGLFYDKKNGYLLKLDFFHSAEPKGCFFGRRRVCILCFCLLFFSSLGFLECMVFWLLDLPGVGLDEEVDCCQLCL